MRDRARAKLLANPPKRRRIKAKSDRQRVRDARYAKAKREYLVGISDCECCAINPATEIHHKKGTVGSLYWDKRFFMAICRICHCWAHDNPAEAKEYGISISRHQSREGAE